MTLISANKRPSKEDIRTAKDAVNSLQIAIKSLVEYPVIQIKETNELIKLPKSALELLAQIIQNMAEGKPVSIVPIATEMTTQAVADYLGCSRPHVVKLLEGGKIPFTKVGRHRRVKFEDAVSYKKEMKAIQKKQLVEIMNETEDLDLYDL